MNSLIAIQQSGMASELGEVAGGDPLAILPPWQQPFCLKRSTL
jgi:hypothetical protein